METASINYWIMQVAAMLLTVVLIPKLKLNSISGLILMIVGLAVVNIYLWDSALFFSIPDTLSSRTGLLLLANGLIFWCLVKLLPGIEIEGLMPAIVAPIVFTLCTVLVNRYGGEFNWQEILKTTAVQLAVLVQQARDFFQAQ